MASNWDDDKRAQAIRMYQEAEPTAETSIEIVKQIAEEMEENVNGVRMVLTRAGVYIKKEGGTSEKKASTNGTSGSTRVSKEAAHARLNSAIEAVGGNVDSEIVGKLTGKAALYLAEILENANK